jgi:thiamine-phosphate pyrophosphorylase
VRNEPSGPLALETDLLARARNARSLRGLYAIVDPASCRGRDPLAVAAAILEGGCALMQLRAKHEPDAALERLARALQALCRAAAVPFVINDHVELAGRIGADGVHIGQQDISLELARARLGDATLIGLSTHNQEQAVDAEARGADLIGFGPVFPTRTKDNPEPVVGLRALGEACRGLQIPVAAIGGITHENIDAVVASGASLAAAISAICAADDPCAAARRLHSAWPV